MEEKLKMTENKSHQNYIIFDFETGGLSANHNPIVELAMIAIKGDNFEEIGRIDSIVTPYNSKGQTIDYDFENWIIKDIQKDWSDKIKKEQKEINDLLKSSLDFYYEEAAMNTHKITEEEFMTKGVEIKDLVKNIISLGEKAKINNINKSVLVGHNVDFDRAFLEQIFKVTNNYNYLEKIFSGSLDYFGNFKIHTIDTIDLAKLIWHKNEGEIVRYSLESCIQKVNIDNVNSHRAMNDVIATKDLFLKFKKLLRSNNNNTFEMKESRFRDNFTFEY